MKQKTVCGVVFFLAMASVAAKGEGCSGELTNDGTSRAWPTAAPPTPGPAQPMTCRFLAEDNCWKRLVTKAVACAGDVTTDARFDGDRKICTAPSGARLELGGAVNTPAPNNTSVVGTDWRLLDARGGTCATGKILGVGRSLIDVGGEVATLTSTSLLGYQVTCPDGSTWSNENAASSTPDAGAGDADPTPAPASDGVCATFGADYLAKRTPGIILGCEGTSKKCALELWGGPGGKTSLATCAW